MKLYRRDGSKLWWITYSIHGRRYRESAGTHRKAEAEAIMAKRRVELFEGRHFPEKKQASLTVGGLRDLWLDHAKHKRSCDKDEQRFRAIVAFFGAQTLVATIRTTDVERLRDSLLATKTRRRGCMAPATVNRHLALLRSALRYIGGDYHHRDPMAKVKFLPERNKRNRLCRPAEYDQLREAASPELCLAIVLGYEMGMRRAEICSIRWNQVDMAGRMLQIDAEDTKTGEPRRLPLTRMAMAALRSAVRRIDGLVVGMTPDSLTKAFTELCIKLEIKGLVFHDLRATAITRLAKNKPTLAELQKFSGHKSVQALMRYLNASVEDLKDVIDRADATTK